MAKAAPTRLTCTVDHRLDRSWRPHRNLGFAWQAEPGKSWVLFTDTHLRYLLPARLRDNPRLGIFGEVSDSCLLTEPEPGTTRVVRRMRLRCGPWLFRMYVVPIVLVWGEEITARNFLRGVKRRAESGHAVPSG